MTTQPSRQAANAWIFKAKSDLDSARLLITGNERHLDTGSYHCQQAAEKSLKAWLTLHEIPFQKTHDLELLLDLCVREQPAIEHLRTAAEELSPLALEYRYPGDIFEPPLEEARRMLSLAEDVYSLVSSQFSDPS